MARTTHELEALFSAAPSAAVAPALVTEGFVVPDCTGIGVGTLYMYSDGATPVTIYVYVAGAWRVHATVVCSATNVTKVIVPGRARTFIRPTAATGTLLSVAFAPGAA